MKEIDIGKALYCSYEDDFYSKYDGLVQFVEKNNSRLPSQNSKNEEEKRLGEWCQTQRKAYKGQGTYKITKEQIKLLEKIPGWYWSK